MQTITILSGQIHRPHTKLSEKSVRKQGREYVVSGSAPLKSNGLATGVEEWKMQELRTEDTLLVQKFR